MPPKKKARTAPPNASSAPEPSSEPTTAAYLEKSMKPFAHLNEAYYANVQSDIDTIIDKWPNIVSFNALPESGADGYLSMVGYGAPFSPVVFDARQSEAVFELSCHVNFMWQDFTKSVMPWIPLYWERTVELSEQMPGPGLLKSKLVFAVNFTNGDKLPRGGLLRVSPCEQSHAVLHKIANRIRANAQQGELDMWLRSLLSAPCSFQKAVSEDAKYAEANSLRQDACQIATAVALTARQLIYNVNGFKAKKEKPGQPPMSAEKLAKFWEDNIRVSTSQKFMTTKSAIDVCMTLFQRMFSIPEVEDLVKRGESKDGPESWLNSIWKLQEIIYRCNRKDRILWMMYDIEDQQMAGRLTNKDISIASLKSGSKSITDPAMARLALKGHLLGPWLDALDVPPYMKKMVREIFESHESYRRLYSPIATLSEDVIVDTTWIFKWPKFGRDLVDFLETAIYAHSGAEDHTLRMAVKNCNTPDEILTNRPWCDRIEDLRTKIRTTVVVDPPAAGPGGGGAQTPNQPPSMNTPGDDDLLLDTTACQELNDAATSLTKRLTVYLEEPASFTALRDNLQREPLATVMASRESGNVMVLADCNTYGETDSRPDRRTCPIHKDKLDILLRAIVAARHGTDTPDELHIGDLYCCINAGKDRKRLFTKPLQNPNMKKGKDPNRFFTRSITLHVTEQSWRARRKRTRGQALLTQGIYLSANMQTFIRMQPCDYPTIGGSNQSDIYGPIELDPLVDLPKMTLEQKKQFYGKRFVLAGGAVPTDDLDDDNDDDLIDDDNDVAEADSFPINYHALPVHAISDLARAFNVKHVIDLMPNPLNLGYELMSHGCSYVAVCATSTMKDYLKDRTHDAVKTGLVNPDEPFLYDLRFKGASQPLTLTANGRNLYYCFVLPPLSQNSNR